MSNIQISYTSSTGTFTDGETITQTNTNATGKIVSSNFTIPNPSNPNANLNPVNAVSNYEYETRLNDAKRNVYVLKPIYLQQFLLDMRTVMDYQESSQYVSEKLIRTENTRNHYAIRVLNSYQRSSHIGVCGSVLSILLQHL